MSSPQPSTPGVRPVATARPRALRLAVIVLVAVGTVPFAAQSSSAPQVTALVPAAGVAGDEVLVLGRGFGARNMTVTLGGLPVPVLAATGASARIVVPAGVPAGPARLVVTNPGGLMHSAWFEVRSRFTGSIAVIPDTARAVADTVGPTGGELTATTADGIRLTLRVPPGALPADTPITLSPVQAINDLPLTGGLSVAAHFAPEGLTFAIPAALVIDLGSAPAEPLVGFSFAGFGAAFSIVKAAINGSSLTVPVPHFSGAGAGTPLITDFLNIVNPLIQQTGVLTFGQLQMLAELIDEWTRIFGPTFCSIIPECTRAQQKARESFLYHTTQQCEYTAVDFTSVEREARGLEAIRLLLQIGADWIRLGLGPWPTEVTLADGTITNGHACIGASLSKLVAAATTRAQATPFGASPLAPARNNLAWLIDLAALASQLGYSELVSAIIEAGNQVIRTVGGNLDLFNAALSPLAQAPAPTTPEADIDGDVQVNRLEMALYLHATAHVLGLDDMDGALLAAVARWLDDLVERGRTTCETDQPAGTRLLERGLLYANHIGSSLLASEFELSIMGCPVRVTIDPAAVDLDTGDEHQFTGSVTGVTNPGFQELRWSATGGTVTDAGLYTASVPAGVYQVVVKSDTFTWKSATATVTVGEPISVTLTPVSATVEVEETQQFAATVNGTSNQDVQWSASCGTVTTAGLFKAPATAGTCTVTATSVEDTTKSADAIVTVEDPPVAVTIQPDAVTLAPGETQQFLTLVTGTTNAAVTWSATRVLTGGSVVACGSVSPSGLFSAPSVAPDGPCLVTATSVADAAKSATAVVTVDGGALLISPSTVALSPGTSALFSTTLNGEVTTDVTWTATCGTVDGGFYTAPPQAGTCWVTATSKADPTESATATVTLLPPGAAQVIARQGSVYALALTGKGDDWPLPAGECDQVNGPNQPSWGTAVTCSVTGTSGSAKATTTLSYSETAVGGFLASMSASITHTVNGSVNVGQEPEGEQSGGTSVAQHSMRFGVNEPTKFRVTATWVGRASVAISICSALISNLCMVDIGNQPGQISTPNSGVLEPGIYILGFGSNAQAQADGNKLSDSASGGLTVTLELSPP